MYASAPPGALFYAQATGKTVNSIAITPPELAAGMGVVAQAGRVQRQRHEAVEGQPAAGLLDGGGDLGLQCGACALRPGASIRMRGLVFVHPWILPQ